MTVRAVGRTKSPADSYSAHKRTLKICVKATLRRQRLLQLRDHGWNKDLERGQNSDPSVGLLPFRDDFRPFKHEILGSRAVLDKEAPGISVKLTILIDGIDRDTHGDWNVEAMVHFVEESDFRELISSLRADITTWLHEHA